MLNLHQFFKPQMSKALLLNKGFHNAVLSLAIKTIKLRYKNSFYLGFHPSGHYLIYRQCLYS